jgi:predicted nucleic acid-binding protein
MNLVIDASVSAKWFFKEQGTDDALALLDGCHRGEIEFLAPEILTAEMANLIWNKVLRRAVAADQACTFLDAFQRVPVRLSPASEVAGAALRLAVKFRHSAYDCLYVTLAAREGCELMTADKGLYHVFRRAFPQVRLLGDSRLVQ